MSCCPWNATGARSPAPEREQINNLTSTCWQVWISLPIRLSKSLVLLIRLLRLESKACCKAKLKMSMSLHTAPPIHPPPPHHTVNSWINLGGGLGEQEHKDCIWPERNGHRRGHTRLPLDMSGHISGSDQRRAPRSSPCAKDPIILPAEATELSRASASDLDN